ncbi:MAG: hypothetical protein JW891_05785 [Candidatus Lokiarchaeota archaeon]|nr:hypothetical protein [Candidatus Lokiarchaeota archaeon]
MENQHQKYKKSRYHFKSPHWKSEWGLTFNYLSKIAGDHRVMPSKVPYSKSVWIHRETPEQLQQSEEIVEMLNGFMSLDNYTDLELLENTLPLRYVYVLPARYGIVVYSAYSFLISHEKGSLADYKEVREYLGIPYSKTEGIGYTTRNRYYVYGLLKHYFRLYTISTPFRCLLNLPIRYPKNNIDKNKLKEMISNANSLTNNSTKLMKEWECLSSPGLFLTQVHDLLLIYGFKTALQYVRYAFRASGKIRELLIRGGEFEKIKSLTERYLNLDVMLKLMNIGEDPDAMDQSSLGKWM